MAKTVSMHFKLSSELVERLRKLSAKSRFKVSMTKILTIAAEESLDRWELLTKKRNEKTWEATYGDFVLPMFFPHMVVPIEKSDDSPVIVEETRLPDDEASKD